MPTAAPATASAPAQTAAPVAETIKLGVLVSLSGANTASGTNNDRFIRMGIDDVNAAGGVKVGGKTYRFEPVTVDNKSTSEAAVTGANRLVLAEKVGFVLVDSSSATAGAQTVTEPNKVLALAFAAADKSLGPNYPLTLQVGISHNIMRIKVLYDWLAAERKEVKRVAVVNSDDVTGRALAAVS